MQFGDIGSQCICLKELAPPAVSEPSVKIYNKDYSKKVLDVHPLFKLFLMGPLLYIKICNQYYQIAHGVQFESRLYRMK